MLEGRLFAHDGDRKTIGKYLQAVLFPQYKQLSVSLLLRTGRTWYGEEFTCDRVEVGEIKTIQRFME